MSPDFNFLEQQFNFPGPVTGIAPLGSGHIHDTYLVTCGNDASSSFVLQKFNHFVFKKPTEVANNIWLVLNNMNSSYPDGAPPLHICKTKSGQLLYQSPDGEYWRVFNYVAGSESFDQVTDTDQAYGAASAFGSFIDLLKDLDPKELHTTIPDFHNLKVRFDQLKHAIDTDTAGRVRQYSDQVDFALQREDTVLKYSDLAASPQVPLRVTHNDTKINNVLFRKGTTTPVCVIDLDTVMPGLLLYDFGDMARTFCNSVMEEAPHHLVHFRTDIFESLSAGFFDSTKIAIAQEELDSIKLGPWWMTFIMGIRFLTDFLSGDIYYKTSYPGQNLDRARNQFQLLTGIEQQQSNLDRIIEAKARLDTHS